MASSPRRITFGTITCLIASLPLLAGCPSKSTTSSGASKPEVFSLTWSEYPSWSVFGVAHEAGLLDQAEGKLGEIERKWNVDIVLKQADYDKCIEIYGTGNADAVCITNMDILGPSLQKASVVLFPTSTSDGADACIAVDGLDLESLKTQASFGLERSVSQYCFERVLEKNGLNPSDYTFSNMDPAIAAQALQSNDEKIKSIVVWNPFVMQTLESRSDAKVLFDSSAIPEEIVDMVVASKQAMQRKGGKDFAYALMETFYEVSRRIDDPKSADETLVALGEKFSNLDAKAMKTVVTQTKFYKSPKDAIALLEKKSFRDETMPTVAKFCVEHEILTLEPGKDVSLGFDASDKQLNFSSEYLKGYLETTAKK